jgi:hypothetical protein
MSGGLFQHGNRGRVIAPIRKSGGLSSNVFVIPWSDGPICRCSIGKEIEENQERRYGLKTV